MATRGVSMTIPFVAWDTSANAGKTGDGANFTMRWVKDGTAAALTTTTVTEVDSTNCPGLYRCTISSTEADCDIGVLAGKSSTSGVSIMPVLIQFERLPNAAPNASGGLVTNGTGTGQISLASGAVIVQSGTGTGQLSVTSGVVAANVTQFGGSAGTFASGRPEVNATHWGGTAVASATVRADLQTIKTQAVTCAAGVTILASVGTATTSTAQSGDAYALIGAAGAGLTAIGDTRLDNLDAAITSRLADAAYQAPLTAAGTRAALGMTGANLDIQLAAIASDTAAILDDTGTSGVVVASGSKSGYSLAAAGLDSITVESGVNARQALSPILAAAAGVVSGAEGTSVTIKGGNVATTRITATVDSDGNRSAVTLNLPA